jgi:hypothetical protein
MLEAVAVSTPAVEEMEHPEVALTFMSRTSYPEVLVKTGWSSEATLGVGKDMAAIMLHVGTGSL